MKIEMTSRKLHLILVVMSAALTFLPAYLPVKAQKQSGRELLRTDGVKELPAKAKRFALVVGVDEYQDQQISALNGAANDARLLAKALIENAGFDSDNVKLVATGEPPSRQPSRGNILRWLSQLRLDMPKDGLLLFSFAGHGMERDGRAYLLPADAQINGDLDLLENTSLNVQSLSDTIRKSGIKQVMMILDACRNNPEGRDLGLTDKTANKLTESYTKGFNFEVRNQDIEAFVKFYSTSVGQLAYEDKDRNQGYFTYALVEGLRGAAANTKGEVTLSGLVKYVQEQVPKRIASNYGREKHQKPWADMQGYKADDLVISIAIKVSTEKPVPSAVDLAAIELAFWESIKNSTDIEDFQEYLKQYPNGRFSGLARNKVRQLEAVAKSNTPASNSTSNPNSTESGSTGIARPSVRNPSFPRLNPRSEEKPGDVKVQTYIENINGVTIDMVLVPSGKFMMGSPVVKKYRETDEEPQHNVTISKSFYMSKYEVTQYQWEIVASLPKVMIDLNPEPSYFKSTNFPVEQVSWNEAVEFCDRLSRWSGKRYRLPTEAEWEYACRAGTTGQYAGNLDAMAWYDENSNNKTQTVGQKQQNRFGLYDMHGNVSEWCQDWFGVYEGRSQTDPLGPIEGSLRVDRGGSWNDTSHYLRSALRRRRSKNNRTADLGFRLVMTFN